jgi:hypothetical protein
MASFWRFFGGTVVRPARTFAALQADSRQVAMGVRAVLFIGVLYTITVAMLAAGGALITAPAFLVLPAENYYFYEIFFAAPVLFLDWIMAAGLARLLGRPRCGTGSFEGTLAALGFAVSVPFLITWVVETAFAVFLLLGGSQQAFMELSAHPGVVQTFVIAYQLVAVVWLLVLTILAVRAGLKTGWVKAVLVGAVTTFVFLGWMVVFIR